jgi:hypothetical protein
LAYLVSFPPPLVLSFLDPAIFFKVLDFAGTYGGKDPFTVSLIQRRNTGLLAVVGCNHEVVY